MIIVKTIVAVAGESIEVNGKVNITSTVENAPSLTTAADDQAGALFDIKNGATLALGVKDDDKSFIYGGTATNNATRRLATVESGAALTINGGTFQYVTVSTTSTNDNVGTVTTRAGIATNRGGAITVESGLFDNIRTRANDNEWQPDRTGIFNQSDGSIVINGGTFSNNIGIRGSVISNAEGAGASSIAIHGGAFKGNSTNYAGGVIMQNNDQGTLTIDGSPTFSGNESGTNGGVISHAGKLEITGGTFEKNVAKGDGGGAIHQGGNTNTASTVIRGAKQGAVKFIDNVHSLNDCEPGEKGEGTAGCRAKSNGTNGGGGGAIHTDYGVLRIEGGVTFQGNHSNASGWMVGGGAIYADHELWVLNSTDGIKPQFVDNWSTVGADSPTVDINGSQQVPTGGAGGAIFLQGRADRTSLGYIMGGEYKNNVSGYLGGAIYTEENTTAYVGKALITDNTAGHFGGGLWLCPSGSANSSQGGNAAIYGNKVDETIDANAENLESANGFGTTAGDDFSMMNPAGKSMTSTQFTLMNTWFSNRSTAAVTWNWDGTTNYRTNGFMDAYQKADGSNWGMEYGANALKTNKGLSGFKQRYTDSKSSIDTPVKLILENSGRNDSTQTEGADALAGMSTLTVYTGVGFKAELKADDAAVSTAKANASMTLTGNQARLSGGAFGSNGVVMFSTPYGVSWSKVKAGATADTKPDDYLLANSAWKLTTTDGGPLMDSMQPAECRTADAKASAATSPCWTSTTDSNGTTTWTLPYVQDNGMLDTDSDKGRINLDNLAPGTYQLTEVASPNGYQGTSNVYEFTITKPQAGTVPEDPTITLIGHLDGDGNLVDGSDGNGDMVTGLAADPYAIGNKPAAGKAEWGKFSLWSKGDGTEVSKQLSGSEWQVTQIKDAGGGDIANGTSYTVTDCTENCPTDATAKIGEDTAAGAGSFSIKLNVGTYKLVETKAPDGYWLPDPAKVYYTFTVYETAEGKETTIFDAAGEPLADNAVKNTPRQVSWLKVDGADMSKSLDGSVWTVQKTAEADETPVTDAPLYTVTDCGSTDCFAKSNDDTKHIYADRDTTAGRITIAELELGTYVIRETTAPDGYQLPDDADNSYTFTIASADYDAETGVQQVIQVGGRNVVTADGAISKIKNYPKPIVGLPFTGGRSALDWLLLGGGLALAAAVISFGVNEYRKRRSLML